MEKIPASVLAVLKHKWVVTEGYSAFDSVFNDREDEERRRDPSYYHIRTGKKIDFAFDQFTHAEAKSLVMEGVFGALAVSRDGGVVINEHAQHALTDFCSEVYAAWGKYQRRLAEVEKAGASPLSP